MCHDREAVHIIRGWSVCGDSHCKYEAWDIEEVGLKESEAPKSEERKDEL